MRTSRKQRPWNGIAVGSRVVYHMPLGTWDAEVIEDRGNIGVSGRRLFRIRTFDEYDDARIVLEVPAKDLTLADDLEVSGGFNGHSQATPPR
ncbi:MAG TPA: hypothetical protein VEX86_12935 [Longimicrobium sp.]|nr:hypothetical protein [Longimicrobium sp.]